MPPLPDHALQKNANMTNGIRTLSPFIALFRRYARCFHPRVIPLPLFSSAWTSGTLHFLRSYV